MKAFSDFIAIILFFGTYVLTRDIIAATVAAVAVGIAQAAYTLFKYRKMEPMQWISLILIVVFGGLTIFLQDRTFMMLKSTILPWLIAAVMLAAQLMGKNGLRLLLAKEIPLPDQIWNRVGYAWVAFFFFLGALNLWVAYPFSIEREALWVKFKLVYLALTFAFAIAQGLYIYKHLPKETA